MISSFSLSSVHIPPLPKPNQIQRKNLKSSSSPTETLTPTPKDLLDNFNTVFELKQLHSYIIKTNKDYSILPVTRIASICALSPSFDYARTIFERVEKNETFIWNSCLKTYAESESPIDAIHFFYRLRQSNLCPDTFTCSFVLKACSILLDLHNGRIVHGLVLKLGYQSDLFLQNTIVHMYAKGGAINDARKLFEKMPRRDSVTWNILITQLTKLNEIDKAQELFDQMPDKSVRSWTAMIAGYVQCGKPKEAVELFKQMEEAGESPNEVTVVAVLAACADLGTLDLGRRIHEYLDKCGYRKNVRVCNTLIDMYIKCGCLEIARSVFDEMEERTIVSWSAMIGGLAMHGEGEEALKLFSKMTRIGIRPNAVTFVGLLHACSHMGLIAEGREFFTSMTRDYGITPELEHYGCMVDLLSRSGLLSEAHEFIKNMPIKANGVVWGALLGGCRVHKNIKLAEEAIKHLQVLDPLNDGYYVVLSNIYAEKGRWEETARVRRLMKDRGVKKTPGWSTVTVNGEVHEFVAGDGNHPQAEEIYQKWDELLTQMKPRGYIPNTKVVLLDMDGEENKVQVLYRHSEKLATMFGLMKTPPGTTIRIMKNLRVCEDCHSALKLISDIVDREIVVRDRNRFHCFKNGLCSCRDYW
ncbi:pentatricopeptide repeat-containing protein At5g66520-like [Papaver somniferum]|nr:pentatricopeptide repeat-containing protein At5g66520-like [Papaver somniferum]